MEFGITGPTPIRSHWVQAVERGVVKVKELRLQKYANKIRHFH